MAAAMKLLRGMLIAALAVTAVILFLLRACVRIIVGTASKIR